MITGTLEIGAAVLAYTATTAPWVRAQITPDERLDVNVAGRLLLRGTDGSAATAVFVVSGLLAVLGAMWFWYGLDRGVHLPLFAHPALGVVASVVGAGVALMARLGYLFWQDAFIAHARLVGGTKDAMRQLLSLHPPPSIAMQELSGLFRFGGAMLLALGASLVAWWSQRSRA
jgi:hypothetical protein